VQVPLAHWGSDVQGWPLASRQVWMVTRLQAWVAGLGQSVERLHWTQVSWSASTVTSQTGSAPVHRVAFVAVHCTHVWLVRSQAGVAGVAVQLASEVHPTQVFVVVLQTGVAPVHALGSSAVHCTHVFVVVLQAGVVPEQFASTVQATQVFVVVLHAGVVPEHCVLFKHWTQEAAVPPRPLQTPPVHTVPGPALAHVPVAQVLHSPAQALLQQTLATQLPVVHWSPPPQAEPSAPLGTQVPEAPGFLQ